MWILPFLGGSDNHISLLSFLSYFYIHVKTGICLKYWFFPVLPHYNVLFSGPNAQEDLWLWFCYSCYFSPLNSIDFVPPSKNIKDKKEKQLFFKNIKIFIYLDPGPFSWDHRTESYLKGSSLQPVAVLPCCSSWAVGRQSQGRAWEKWCVLSGDRAHCYKW